MVRFVGRELVDSYAQAGVDEPAPAPTPERFAQLLTVTRDDRDFTAAAGSANVEQFLFHGIG